MLKFAADLSDANEYGFVWAGQSNARAWGTKTEGYTEAPELQLDQVGVDLSDVVIVDNGARVVGTVEVLSIGTTLTADEWNGTHLRFGSKTAALVGKALVISNAASTVTVQWIILPTNDVTQDGWLIREDFRWASYPEVRVLTTYQALANDKDASIPAASQRTVPYPTTSATLANGGRRLLAPTLSIPATVTTFEDLGVFLPFTFAEGLDGFGLSEASDSTASPATHAAASISSTTFGWSNAVGVADYFIGGWVVLEWEASSIPKKSWAQITDNTTTGATVAAWLGDGEPAAFGDIKRFTVWQPYWNDNPHSVPDLGPGEGFTYPNNDHQPYNNSAIGAQVHNRPRGITGSGYGDRFGSMLNFGWRMSAALGKRINIIPLGVNSASQIYANTQNMFGFFGTAGWYDYKKHLTWALAHTGGIWDRLSNLITTVAPNALTAEGNGKTLKILGGVFIQGEGDAISPGGREIYDRTLRTFVKRLRKTIHDASMNPYAKQEMIPFVQPLITNSPWELSGTYTYYGVSVVLSGDSGKLVNSAIKTLTTADEFAGHTVTDDLGKLDGTTANGIDIGHFNGKGEAIMGERLSDTMGELIDYALEYGSTLLNTSPTREIDLCNDALALIGQAAEMTSFSDGSTEASLCSRFYPESRDAVLQMRTWGFALRRANGVSVNKPPTPLYDQYDYCYVVPGEALNVFAVLPDEVDSDYKQVSNELGVWGQERALIGGPAPMPFQIEQSEDGHRLIFTAQKDAVIRYTARVVDADRFSPNFAKAVACHLAAQLAGAVIKGDKGEAIADRMLRRMGGYLHAASASTGNQRMMKPTHIPDHLAER